MREKWENTPGWLQALIVAVPLLAGTNGAQYLGFAKPNAQQIEQAEAVMAAANAQQQCFENLTACYAQLRVCQEGR